MARRYNSRSTAGYRAPRRSSRNTRPRSSRSYAAPRRATRARTSRAAPRTRDIRIIIEQPNASAVARPDLIGKMPITGITRNRSRF